MTCKAFFFSMTLRIGNYSCSTVNKLFEIILATMDQEQSGTQIICVIFIIFRPEEA